MSKAFIELEGFVCDNVMYHEDKGGLPLLQFNVSVPGKHEGEETSFFAVRAWGKLAKMGRGIIEKRKYVRVHGNLKQRRHSWTTEEGEKRYNSSIGIVAHFIDLPREV